MSDTLPEIGQDPWGVELNAYLADLEARVAAMEARPQYVFNSYAWTFSNSAPPSGNNQVRLNNSIPNLVTLIDFRRVDSDGADRTAVFQLLSYGSTIRINDWDDTANLYRYQVTAAPTFDATNVQIPVAWDSGSGVVPNGKANVAFLIALKDF